MCIRDRVYSLSAGLDYPGIGPEHAQLAKTGRGEYFAITDEEAVCAFEYLSLSLIHIYVYKRQDVQCVASNDPAMQEKAFDILENLHIDVVNR